VTRILVIKLGALGDFILALGPMAAIRRHHPEARITLLTSAAYAGFAAASPYFDEIWIDRRPGIGDPAGLWRLRRRIRGGRFERVYDLQTSDRSGWYFRLIGPGRRPEWSGIASGCSHPHDDPRRDRMHTIDRQRDQLASAGIDEVPLPDLSWSKADAARFGLSRPYALLVPGGAAHRPEKRWPAERFAALAGVLAARGVQPALIGSRLEQDLARQIQRLTPSAVDLTGQTDFLDLAALGRAARLALGNDTGPMHILAAAGAPSTVLFSAASDPALTAPRGVAVTILSRNRLADLTADEVAASLCLG
jgi:ADP-heptose:LPS heptosyltransferase